MDSRSTIFTHQATGQRGHRSLTGPVVTPNNVACKNKRKNHRLARLAYAIQTAEDRYLKNTETKSRPGDAPPSCRELIAYVRSITDKFSARSLKKVSLCPSCSEKLDMQEFKSRMTAAPDVCDPMHLAKFERCARMVIGDGWDRRVNIGGERREYVPNGAATLNHGRRHGGNWNKSSNRFEPLARIVCVPSTGKDRIVSVFDESMSILRPAHKALYDYITQRSLHVRGEFTQGDVEDILRSGKGNLVSGDYSSATDNIKKAYVKAIVRVLLQRSRYLNAEEREALNKFGDVVDVDTGREWTKGQPMGALLSFPILCIWNRCLFEMALADEARRLRLSNKEYCKYQQKINGDDIAFRELVDKGNLASLWRKHCSMAGVIVNDTKTGVHPDRVELNSKTYMVENEVASKVRTINWKVLDLNRESPDLLVVIADCVLSVGARMAASYEYARSIRGGADKRIYDLDHAFQEALRRTILRSIRGSKSDQQLADALLHNGPRRGVSPLVRVYRWKENTVIDSDDRVMVNAEKRATIAKIRRIGNFEKKILKAENEKEETSTWSSQVTPPEQREGRVVMEYEYRVLRDKHNLRLRRALYSFMEDHCVSPSFVKTVPRGSTMYYRLARSTFVDLAPD